MIYRYVALLKFVGCSCQCIWLCNKLTTPIWYLVSHAYQCHLPWFETYVRLHNQQTSPLMSPHDTWPSSVITNIGTCMFNNVKRCMPMFTQWVTSCLKCTQMTLGIRMEEQIHTSIPLSSGHRIGGGSNKHLIHVGLLRRPKFFFFFFWYSNAQEHFSLAY